MKKKNFKFLLKSLFIFTVFLFPGLVKATSLEELKQQFINLGGSNEGFNKIIQVVEKSQASSKQLKNKISEVYNKQLYDLMIADNFDYKAYIQTYNNLEKEKYNLTNQNLNDMVGLLNSLSLNDRKAYASLLYNISSTKNMNTSKDLNKDTSTSNSNVTNNKSTNTTTNTSTSSMLDQQNTQSSNIPNNDMSYGDSNNNNPSYNLQPNDTSNKSLNNEEQDINQNMNTTNSQVQNYQYNYNNMTDNNG